MVRISSSPLHDHSHVQEKRKPFSPSNGDFMSQEREWCASPHDRKFPLRERLPSSRFSLQQNFLSLHREIRRVRRFRREEKVEREKRGEEDEGVHLLHLTRACVCGEGNKRERGEAAQVHLSSHFSS